VAVAEDGAAEAGEHIDIFLAVGIPEAGALAAHEDRGQLAVIEDHGGLVAIDELLIGHGARRSEKKRGGAAIEDSKNMTIGRGSQGICGGAA